MPLWDKTYLREKALKARKGAEEILAALDDLEIEDEKWHRSYVIDGILVIEDALGSLHVGAKNMMEICEETEDDYMLRHIGEIKKGL